MQSGEPFMMNFRFYPFVLLALSSLASVLSYLQ